MAAVEWLFSRWNVALLCWLCWLLDQGIQSICTYKEKIIIVHIITVYNSWLTVTLLATMNTEAIQVGWLVDQGRWHCSGSEIVERAEV